MRHLVTPLACVILAGGANSAVAQPYPSKPVRIIAPFAPGGGIDFIARVAAQKMTETLGQQVIVDNRPGAGGTVGTEIGVRAPPDGYTFVMVATTYSISPSLYKVAFDPVHDITPVIQLSQGPLLLVTHPSLPAVNVQQLIALGKAKPQQLIYASGGTGGVIHLSSELFADMAGIKMVHVPYKGLGPALTDLIAGQVQLLFGSITATLPQTKNGRLRALAVTTPKRTTAAPEIPTVAESGLKDYAVTQWHGLIAPKGLPKPILERINGDLNKIVQSKDMQEKLAGDGVTAAGGTPEQFAALIKNEIGVWQNVVRKAGVKSE
ncbi:MAG: tripartite tricarboxylate transporter substrate binding protein [Betaproteobacteria bacterium]|nr:tripartite tricarboxylate transporter substrate binding protein [Betaproteobacteria bacterium]